MEKGLQGYYGSIMYALAKSKLILFLLSIHQNCLLLDRRGLMFFWNANTRSDIIYVLLEWIQTNQRQQANIQP